MSADRNREAQTELYGEPLGSLFGQISTRLGLTQSRIAAVLGISAPMLSQLMSAQRVKIGNPAAAARLGELLELSANAHTLSETEQQQRLEAIASSHEPVTSSVHRVGGTTTQQVDAGYRVVQDLFRDVAGATDFLAAAQALDAQFPQIAELLSVYGAGRTADAKAHYERTRS